MIIVAKKIWPPVGSGMLFYYWEIIGLTGILLYTPVLVLAEAEEKANGEPHMSLTEKLFGSDKGTRERKKSSK